MVPAGAGVDGTAWALAPASPVIAAACFAVLGASVVLIAMGLRMQWRGFGVRPWLLVLLVALVLAGLVTTWAVGGWLGELSLVYGGFDGLPAAPTPSSLIGSWPLVDSAGTTALVVGAVGLFLVLNTAAIREGMSARTRS